MPGRGHRQDCAEAGLLESKLYPGASMPVTVTPMQPDGFPGFDVSLTSPRLLVRAAAAPDALPLQETLTVAFRNAWPA